MVRAYQLEAVNTHKLGLSLGDGKQKAAFSLCDFGDDVQDVTGWLQTLPDGHDLTDPRVQAWEDHLHNTIIYYKQWLRQPKNLGIYANLNSAETRRYRSPAGGRGDEQTFVIHDNWTGKIADYELISSRCVTPSDTIQGITDWIISEIDRLACTSSGQS
jgi:hypothetical protein